jgi:L-ascorbate metabolism protein UlaG (beta-lactamase superfamily)
MDMTELATRIRFHGVANYEIITSEGKHILVDPFFDHNPASINSDQLERVDLICVSHAAFDHMGDAEAIARRTGAPVICGGDVQHYLMAKGIPEKQTRATVWGIAVEVAGIKVQPVESHHWSQMNMPDGTRISGVPIGFVIYADPGVRFYHYGDTAIFSDLKLIGELFQPTIGCLGITQPIELEEEYDHEAGRVLTGEMSPREGALAAQWLGLDVVFPCHYLNPDCADVRDFNAHLERARKSGGKVAESVVLKPGEEYVTYGSSDGARHSAKVQAAS